ncbi:MAG: hypothetical protein A2X58_09325 [Nitrospirae bacterium GWC2_56_14]|nr:MAG: hypothetical protein A2X58_09325 [Nitrospirae bacterium GWC2_56_14]
MTFTQMASQQTKKADPAKHVNFTQGMILGVDEFVQEFTYLSGRDQWINRDLMGYGTVSGLSVNAPVKKNKDNIDETWVEVSAGSAVSPRGLMIRVPRAQCANLTDWLAKQDENTLNEKLEGSPSNTLPVYVTLAYTDCLTDDVPIPGEPCRSEDELEAPSRLKDGFVLELSLDPPAQCEEDALRKYVQWLADSIHLTADASAPDVESFRRAIRDAVHIASPPCPALEFGISSPPTNFTINVGELSTYLRAAFLLWVTEFRPYWKIEPNEPGPGCGETASASQASEETVPNKVLLARLEVPMTGNEPGGEVTINEDNRPYLLHLRMLQEWMLCREGKQD